MFRMNIIAIYSKIWGVFNDDSSIKISIFAFVTIMPKPLHSQYGFVVGIFRYINFLHYVFAHEHVTVAGFAVISISFSVASCALFFFSFNPIKYGLFPSASHAQRHLLLGTKLAGLLLSVGALFHDPCYGFFKANGDIYVDIASPSGLAIRPVFLEVLIIGIEGLIFLLISCVLFVASVTILEAIEIVLGVGFSFGVIIIGIV